MKKAILYSFIGFFVLAVACDPIEDRDELGRKVPASEFDYSITQDPENDYLVTLENNTPDVLFSWDYAWGVTTKQKATVRMLVPGTYTIKITATTDGGIVFDEYEITVNDSDPEAFQEPEWEMLTNMAEGKSWAWDLSLPGAAGNGGYAGCFAPCWWVLDASGLEEQGVLNDYMTFDLNGGRNLTRVAESLPEPGAVTGSFDLNMTENVPDWSVGTLTTKNVTVPFGWDINNNNSPFYTYHILKITDTELHLAASQPGVGAWGEAWFYMFAPKED
jgi:hypothetical protein